MERASWDDYFLEVMKVVATRATCDRGRSGCVIVSDDNLILTTGYVGSPPGIPHCDEVGHQFIEQLNTEGKKSQHCIRTTHAEWNAIAQAARHGISLKNAALYCTMEPCYTCAKLLIQVGIRRVVCLKRYHAAQLTRQLLKDTGVVLEVKIEEVQEY